MVENKQITSFYYSNCWIEAIKAKLKNPSIKLYVCNPYRGLSGDIRSGHVMWEDENYSYDFSDESWDDSGKIWQYFWYKGCIRQWPKNFAKEFSERRNRMAKKSWKRGRRKR